METLQFFFISPISTTMTRRIKNITKTATGMFLKNLAATYWTHVTIGSGNPSASQASMAEWPTSAVALMSDWRARMVGRTNKRKG